MNPVIDKKDVKPSGSYFRYESTTPTLNKLQEKEEEKQKSYVPTLKPEVMTPSVKVQNRGFADALILTIIVLVYAAIIINLILKLK